MVARGGILNIMVARGDILNIIIARGYPKYYGHQGIY